MVETLPSNAGGTGSIPGREAKIPHTSCVIKKKKKQNRNNIETNSIKTSKYWSGLPFPPPGNLPDPGIKPASPTSQANSLPTEPAGELYNTAL